MLTYNETMDLIGCAFGCGLTLIIMAYLWLRAMKD
jgi:hypothetical protein